MVKQITCEKCGRVMSARHVTRHKRVCDRVPTPDVLVRMFFDDEEMTLYELEARYDINPTSLKNHMLSVVSKGELAEEIQRRTAARRRRWGELLKEREAGRKSKRKCDICEALLDHPEVMDCGELCGVCAGKVQKMIPAEYSYEPEAVAWW